MLSAISTQIARPLRWDERFGADMGDEDVDFVLVQPMFAGVDPRQFPPSLPLHELIRNDARIMRYEPGEIVLREGDYGSSAFLILEGTLAVAHLPPETIGRSGNTARKGLLSALAQLWSNHRLPEVRDVAHQQVAGVARAGDEGKGFRVFLQDFPVVMAKGERATLGPGVLFGEIGALARMPRTATVVAETAASCLEIRWQGLRDLRRYDSSFRQKIDETYRRNMLKANFRETPLFAALPDEVILRLAAETLFETYGSFDWSMSYKQLRSKGEDIARQEPIIAQKGDYADGLLMIRAGFARLWVPYGSGRRTLSYLGAGDVFGLKELYDRWKGEGYEGLQASLSAVGYVDVLRVPVGILEELVFPHVKPPSGMSRAVLERPAVEDSLMEWVVDERFINGMQAMLIDLDKCVRCDDCVRACAATHDGNPRFIRHGRTFDHWMIANACMHCADPVCMIGCPTGAIHRAVEGPVVVNDATCIGCGTCAASCPYQNIRLVEVSDARGHPLVDKDTGTPILKATKCDLCISNPGGPACVRACPHGALQRVDFRRGQDGTAV